MNPLTSSPSCVKYGSDYIAKWAALSVQSHFPRITSPYLVEIIAGLRDRYNIVPDGWELAGSPLIADSLVPIIDPEGK
ncbi:MAG: hypothetical protein HY912_11235 [Desulfomonile tiedjei]|uniref:Uncharacterized protein n=1 Tax=Desulfomonile tiedjei TaxID=2358 RepID=A0A9D6V6P3_9BACT|nr:hypothetical protein [Desulfomonile tiedjei]